MPKVESSRKKTTHKQSFVPYVKGFRRATKKQQITALGYSKESDIPPELQSYGFDPIKRCTSIDDWLAQYTEPAQSYPDFLTQTPWLSRRKLKYISQDFVAEGKTLPEKYPQGKIYIVALGEFDEESKTRLNALIEYTEIFLGLPVRKLPDLELEITNNSIHLVHSQQPSWPIVPPRQPLRARFKNQNRHKHHQLSITDGLFVLRKYLPKDGLCMIALTNQDLFEAKSDLFVAGMAAGNQLVAIFSLFRYNPNLEFSSEFWYEVRERKQKQNRQKTNSKPKNQTENDSRNSKKPVSRIPANTSTNSRIILQRGCRLLVHEISHLLGLGHCVYFDCCMNGSGHLQEDFSQPMHLCPVDLRKLKALVGFDIVERYTKLEVFYRMHQMDEEADWVQKKLAHIRTQQSQVKNSDTS